MSESSPVSGAPPTGVEPSYRSLEEKVNWLVGVMSERMEREARVSREEVIRNPRLSGGGSFGQSGIGAGVRGGGVSSTVGDPREELFSSPNPPRHQGRLTLSPQAEPEEAKVPVDGNPFLRPAHVAESATQWRAGEERLLKKVKTPPTFSGNEADDEVKEVRDWVEVVDDFFDCMVGPGYDGEYALTFVKNNLRGPAHDWMKSKVSAFEEAIIHGDLPQSMRQGLKWGEVKKLLVEAFESPQYQVMKRFELQELRLGQGKHKTLPIFNAAFDKLSRRLWPIGTDFENNIILDRVLSDEYSSILEKSDIYLWRDVVKTMPRTLSQWKASTAVVWSAREVVKSNDQRNRTLYGGAGRRNQSRPQGTAGAAAQIHEMDTKEEDVKEEYEEEDPASKAPAAAQQMRAERKGNNNFKRTPRVPRLLTDEQMKIVWDKNLCLQCFKEGHHRGDAACEEKGKPRRKPKPGELNA
jgi:hypothetical protein